MGDYLGHQKPTMGQLFDRKKHLLSAVCPLVPANLLNPNNLFPSLIPRESVGENWHQNQRQQELRLTPHGKQAERVFYSFKGTGMEKVRVLTFRTVNYLADVVVLSLAFVLGFWTWSYIKSGGIDFSGYDRFAWLSWAMIYLIYYGTNFFYLAYYEAYHSSRLRSFPAAVGIYLKSVIMALLLGVLIAFLFPYLRPSRIYFVSATAYGFLLLVGKEYVLRLLLSKLRKHGYSLKRMVIVGQDEQLIQELRTEFERDHILGVTLVGIILPSVEQGEEPKQIGSDLVLGYISRLTDLLDGHCIDAVMFLAHEIEQSVLEDALLKCEERGLETWVKLDLLNRLIYRADIDSLNGIPFINFRGDPQNSAQLFIKYTLDRILSFILLIVLSPLFLAIALVIKFGSPGALIFKQYRAGLNGRRFVFYKFRSMIENAEDYQEELREKNEVDGPAFKVTDDPRVTRVGRFLRKTSLDELPQLWNVLKGDMSLVGPRPLPVDQVKLFQGWHRRRLSMKPGITGGWQVNGRSNVVDFDQWARMDLEYIDNWSLEQDFIILLRTVPAVLFGRGAH